MPFHQGRSPKGRTKSSVLVDRGGTQVIRAVERDEPLTMAPRVDWFFGRGLSISCGLDWSVPPEWSLRHREDVISQIKLAIPIEMSSPRIHTGDIKLFLSILANKTVSPWQHQFHTTNWDYLLQREIFELNLTVQPPWCAETHVYHLNGTVEQALDNGHRSEFVLESDPPSARTATTEGNIAFNRFIWNRTFVVVGMSFECEVDKYLLKSIRNVQDDLPLGESNWYILNPDEIVLANTADRIRAALPRAKVISLHTKFRDWLDAELPELQACDALAF